MTLIHWSSGKQHVRNTHPALAKLTNKYLIVEATSAPVERVFSTAGKIFRTDRCQLSDERFESLMFIPGKKYSVLTTPLSIALVVIPIYQHLSTLKLYR